MITLHSDDYGYKDYSDKKIIQLLRQDRIKSVSVLVNMAGKSSLSSLLNIIREKPEIKIGLHLNLIEGKSLSLYSFIPSLVYGRGNFYPLNRLISRLILRLINPAHIEREIKAQISSLRQSGFKVSFIDSHQHLHAISPFAEIVSKVALEEKVKVVRSYRRIKTYTLIAKIKYLTLRASAIASYFLASGKIGLPVSWNLKVEDSYAFMSWESNNFDISRVKDKKLVFVAHPYLPFDTNTSYMWMF